ncbi:unnamed protein product [Ascophyllum nodosum]
MAEAYFPDTMSPFDGGSAGAYTMPEPALFMDDSSQQYGDMPQHPLDVMPAPSYKPRPTDPYTIEEAAEVIETAKAQFETAIQERADKEAARAAEVRRLAEEELDGFYDQRTDEVARRQARSREQEETFLRDLNASIEGSGANPWARICDLVDLKAPVLPAAPSSSRGGGSRKSSALMAGVEGEDAFRATEKMRSLIIQMKADAAHDAAVAEA